MTIRLRAKSQITLPTSIVKKLNIKPGDELEVEVVDGNIILKPIIKIPKSQAYFWSKTWQEEEKRVMQEIENGEIMVAESLDDLYNKLGL